MRAFWLSISVGMRAMRPALAAVLGAVLIASAQAGVLLEKALPQPTNPAVARMVPTNAILAAEAIRQLTFAVRNAGLVRKIADPLLDALDDAVKDFRRGDTAGGIDELIEFERTVRDRVAAASPDVAKPGQLVVSSITFFRSVLSGNVATLNLNWNSSVLVKRR